jgi:hypothetical protein
MAQTDAGIDRHAGDAYRLIAQVLDEIGPRESCSAEERKLGEFLLGTWQALGLDVRKERFTCHPKAFLGSIPITVVLYLGATASFWWWPWVCAVLAGLALAVTTLELLRYRELIDPLFRREEGENVLGVIRPQGECRQRVIVSAHQDSAYEFNLWLIFRDASLLLMVIGLSAPLLALGAGLARGMAGGGFETLGGICIALYPVVGLHLFFHTFVVVPGAMDDLAGIAILCSVARVLREEGSADAIPLENTEVILLATSAEEAGLRGAKRYALAHRSEFQALPTYGVFIDGVYDERYLTVIQREIMLGARHDPRLVELACGIAAKRGWSMKRGVIPFGASDAAAFSLAGIPSVALLCQDTRRLARNYHTRYDTIEYIRPESLGVMLQLVLDMVRALDRDVGSDFDSGPGRSESKSEPTSLPEGR